MLPDTEACFHRGLLSESAFILPNVPIDREPNKKRNRQHHLAVITVHSIDYATPASFSMTGVKYPNRRKPGYRKEVMKPTLLVLFSISLAGRKARGTEQTN